MILKCWFWLIFISKLCFTKASDGEFCMYLYFSIDVEGSGCCTAVECMLLLCPSIGLSKMASWAALSETSTVWEIKNQSPQNQLDLVRQHILIHSGICIKQFEMDLDYSCLFDYDF